MDGMTNSILAKHILSTGDWKVFHYTPSGYPDYYPHPPFSIWAEAVMFKFFGISDFSARLSPALFGLGTLAGVVYWGALGGSLWEGLIAALILLTSTRYIKYAADAFLEGPLTFWLVWGGVAFLKAQHSRKALFSIGFGICLGFAFLTKTVFAFSLPAALVISSLFGGFLSIFATLGISSLSASAVIGTWFVWGDGIQFLQHHWMDIRDRVTGTFGWLQHLDPTVSLLKTYWPWLPLLIYVAFRWIRRPQCMEAHTRAALFLAGTIFIAFTTTGFYFEHYFVPFYPMAALAIAPFLARWLAPYSGKVLKITQSVAITLAVGFAVFPFRTHSRHTEPLTEALEEIPHICLGEKEILVSDKLMEKWMALAVVLWKMPVEATSTVVTDLDHQNSQPGQLLLAAAHENPNPSQWTRFPLHMSALSLYQPKNFTPLCR